MATWYEKKVFNKDILDQLNLIVKRVIVSSQTINFISVNKLFAIKCLLNK